MEKVIKWFSQNHVAANFLMLLVLLAGFATWFQLRKEIFPETSFDAVVVSVPYPNATPDEVTNGVIIPMEEAITDIEGIKRVTSNASRNIGAMTIEVETGYETRNVMDDVKTQIDAIDNFAENAERPVLEELIVNRQILSLAISANTDEASLREYAETVRDGLLNYEPGKPKGVSQKLSRFLKGDPEIKKVELASVRDYEISIEVSEDRLRKYGLSIQQVAAAVRKASLDLPSGSVKTASGEIVVRGIGKRYRGADFFGIAVKANPDGSVVKLEEVAEIIDGFEDSELSSTFNGNSAVVLHVFSVGEQDTLTIAALAKEYIGGLEKPPGVSITLWNDMSLMLQGRLDLLKRNIGMGLLLVLLVLALFLRPSLAFLVAMGIPVSFAGGMWLMPDFGISLNMISAFAFILVLGIVVDDAIVVGENVYTRIQGGEHPREASWKGTHEVGVVVIFGVLTTAMAFTPMLGLSGVSGKIWPNIPLVVIPVLLFSLVQSKFVLPAHLALLKPTSNKVSRNPLMRLQKWISGGLERFIKSIYTPTLALCLRFRYVVWVAFFGLVVMSAKLVETGRIPFEFMPKVEGEILSAKLEMPLGVPFAETQEAVRRIEEAALRLGAELKDNNGNSIIVNLLATSGMQPFQAGLAPGGIPSGTHLGEVTLELAAAKDRDLSSEELRIKWQELVGDIPGVVVLGFKSETNAGGNAIDVNLTSRDDQVLSEAAAWATEKLRKEYPGVIEVSNSDRRGREEFIVRDLTDRGKALGFDLASVMSQVRDGFYGNEVQRLQRGRDEVKVMVRYPEAERKSVANIESMKLRALNGIEVPLLEVVEPDYGRSPATIRRIDRNPTISMSGDVDRTSGYNADKIRDRYQEEVLDVLAEKFPGVRYSLEGEKAAQSDSIREMMVGFVGALLMMYVLMAIPLKSYIQPLIVMSVIPFGIVGGIAGHIVMDMNLSIMSLCGIVALAGVVVNDSLVLVDYVNRNRDGATTIKEAAVIAGARRFRPILLTSLTTFAGLMPMLLETDLQAKFLIPMAVSLGFGILFATAITLILVPSIYLILDDVITLFRGNRDADLRLK
ncbi:MAG: efflux RND transporter permease subunit [Akkermansiaceae bacterium]|nr:efflux RND transporter permease subunit [Akkermansiaceae bacterium]